MQRHLRKQTHNIYTVQTVPMNFSKTCKEISELYLVSMEIMSTPWETWGIWSKVYFVWRNVPNIPKAQSLKIWDLLTNHNTDNNFKF